jgi:glycosyltransferase 2 family protein
MKRWLTIIVGLLVSAVTLYFAFRNANLAELGAAFRSAHYEYAVLSIFLLAVGTLVRGLRWRVLTGGRLNFPDGFWLWNIGFLFNDVLPAKLGEIVRSLLAGRRPGMSFTSALSSVVVERLFDMLCVVLLLAIALAGNPLPGWATEAGQVMAGVALVGISVLAYSARRPDLALRLGTKVLGVLPRFSQEQAHAFLAPFVEGLGGVRDLRILAGGLGLSLLAWTFSVAAGWAVMHAFWPNPPLMVAILVLAAAGLGVSVPSAPSGIGPYQAAVIGVLSVIHYDLALSQSYAIASHAMVILTTVVLGLIGLAREGVGFGDMARQAQGVRQEPVDAPSNQP